MWLAGGEDSSDVLGGVGFDVADRRHERECCVCWPLEPKGAAGTHVSQAERDVLGQAHSNGTKI